MGIGIGLFNRGVLNDAVVTQLCILLFRFRATHDLLIDNYNTMSDVSYDIPRPTGPYPVACHEILDKTGVDSSRFRIYYPTVVEKCSTWMDWDDLSVTATQAIGNGFCSRIFKCYLKDRKMPVWKNGPLQVPGNISKLPVVLVTHGLTLSKHQCSYISYEIASHGYLVAALDHRDGSASQSLYVDPNNGEVKTVVYDSTYDLKSSVVEEGRYAQLEQRREDITRLLDCVEQLNTGQLKNILTPDFDLQQFVGSVDAERCALVGHSFGGATVVACLDDERVKAGVSLDAWMGVLRNDYLTANTKTPLLFINCEGHLKYSDITKMQQITAGNPSTTRMVTILGSTHLTHTDFAYFPKSRWLAKAIFKSITDPKLANDVSSDAMMGFIAKHLELPCEHDMKYVIAARPDVIMEGSPLDYPTTCGEKPI